MGDIVAFPRRTRSDGGGTVHVMHRVGGGFETAHESSSGNSWGAFEPFDEAADAVSHAFLIARDQYGGCEIFVPQDILDALSAPGHSPEEDWA